MNVNMERELFAVCPGCEKRARIVGHRWDWDAEQDFAQVKCNACGMSEVPFDEGRVVDIDLNNPYMEATHFRLLMPRGMETKTWNMIGGCLMAGWAEEAKREK